MKNWNDSDDSLFLVYLALTILPAMVALCLLTGCPLRPEPPAQPFAHTIIARDAPVYAKPYHGIDPLALQKQDIPMLARTIEPGTMIGTFGDQTFGPGALAALERLLTLAGPKISAFRVHLLWTNHASPSNAISLITSGASHVADIHNHFPNVPCYISPICEYNETNPTVVRAWASATAKAAPGCTVVLTPSGSGAIIPGIPVERHGNTGAGYGRSNDGNILWDSDSAKYRTSGNEYILGWWLRCNAAHAGPYIPPMQRTAQIPEVDARQAAALMKAPDSKPLITMRPPRCKSVRELQNRELWKTNSEDYDNGDPRGNRPVLISHAKSNRLSIISSQGKELGCLKYYGTYSPYGLNWYRHYAGSCDGQSAYSLFVRNGSEWGYVKDGSQCYLINLLRRTGITR